MPNYQKFIAAGHVGRDAETRGPATSWSMAVTEKWRGRDGGQGGERTEWISAVMFGERGQKLAQYIRKGDPILIEGKLRTDKYTGKDGVEKQRTQVVVDQVEFLRGKSDSAPRREQQPAQSTGGGGYDDADYGGDDDIPF